MPKSVRDEFIFSKGSTEVPTRSKLMAIPPMGLGTWKVESLPSYVKRICQANAISLCQLQHMVIGEVGSSRIRELKHSRTRIYWKGFGGLGELTQEWVKGLELLLLSEYPRMTTLYPLAGRIPARNLMTIADRSCPECDRTDLRAGQVYGYLIWRIQSVLVCPVHGCPLEEVLPTVKYCGAQWRTVAPEDRKKKEGALQFPGDLAVRLDSERKRANLVTSFLECPSFRHGFSVGQECATGRFLRLSADRLTSGVLAHLARHLQVSKGGVFDWVNGSHLPSLAQVIDIAEALGCSLESVLSGDASSLPLILPEYARRRPKEPRSQCSVSSAGFQQRLLEVLEGGQFKHIPASLSEVARLMGVDRKYLAESQPTIAKTITHRYKQYRTKTAELRRTIRWSAYREVALHLARLGENPSRNKVMQLAKSLSPFSAADREACQAICLEVRREFGLPSRQYQRNQML